MSNLETLKNELHLAMAGHDWYYDRSDDHRGQSDVNGQRSAGIDREEQVTHRMSSRTTTKRIRETRSGYGSSSLMHGDHGDQAVKAA